MLFIFCTQRSKKILLKISIVEVLSDKSVTISDKHVINSKSLLAALPKSINFPENGQIHHISNVEGLRVLVWNFDVFTPCSQASEDDFSFVDTLDRPFKYQSSPRPPSGDISMPYFTLKQGQSIFLDEAKLIFNETYFYPEVSESLRVDALRRSLVHHKYVVKTIKASKSTNHYCEFSGGGDIYVYAAKSPPLVFVSPEDAEEDEEEDAKCDESIHKVSPVSKGGSKLYALSIEAKKAYANSLKLKHQLWADMISLAVFNFMVAVDPYADICNRSTKQDLLQIDELTGYGVACAGDGLIGVYKLEMKFGNVTSLITKLEIGHRDRLLAA